MKDRCKLENVSKTILENMEYEEYMKNEAKLAEDYKKRLYGNITDDVIAAFMQIKTALNTGENKVEVDGFYFTQEAIDLLNGSTDKGYNLNQYMDLTMSDVLNMIEENNTPQDAIDELFDEYKADSALCWGDNFIEVLKGTGIKATKKNKPAISEAITDTFGSVLDKVIEIEDYDGNTIMAFQVDNSGKIVKYMDCDIADEDVDYLFNTDKILVRIQKRTQ